MVIRPRTVTVQHRHHPALQGPGGQPAVTARCAEPVRSFDFYDTLVCRLAATPSDIFRLVERELGLANFTDARIAAELAARRALRPREVTLDDIYSRMILPDHVKQTARETERRLEVNLVAPVARMVARLRPNDLVVSDTYLDASTIEELLARHADGRRVQVIVSSEIGHRKADGSLWDYLRQRYPCLHEHVGDDRRSDVEHPRRRGIGATLVTATRLDRHERAHARSGLDGSIVAGVSRATRLSLPPATPDPTGRSSTADRIYASVFAPLLVGFVEWMLEEAQARGIDRLWFLARDGYLPYQVARRLIAARGLPVEARYVFGSRHALHLPAFIDIDDAASWLLEDTPFLSLQDIARRGEVPLEVVTAAAAPLGLVEPTANIPRRRRAMLGSIIRDRRFVASLRAASEKRVEAAREYYVSQGLEHGRSVGLVDIGWNGRMQASLRRLLDKSGYGDVPLAGFYLCLSRKPASLGPDDLRSYLDREAEPCGSRYDSYRPVLEAALMADHPTTLEFSCADGVAAPVFGRPLDAPSVRRARRNGEVVNRFVELLLTVERTLERRIHVDRAATQASLGRLLQRPTRREAEALLGRTFFEGQVEDREQPLVRRVRPGLEYVRRERLGLWPEGSLAVSGATVLLPAVAAARWLTRRCSRRHR